MILERHMRAAAYEQMSRLSAAVGDVDMSTGVQSAQGGLHVIMGEEGDGQEYLDSDAAGVPPISRVHSSAT